MCKPGVGRTGSSAPTEGLLMVPGAGEVEPRPYGGQEDLCKPGVGRADVGIGPYGGVQEVRWGGPM